MAMMAVAAKRPGEIMFIPLISTEAERPGACAPSDCFQKTIVYPERANRLGPDFFAALT
jgi:hypothetical protein